MRRPPASACSPARPAAPSATAASPSRTMRSTILGCLARTVPGENGATVAAARVSTGSHDDKTFHPGRVAIRRGARLWIVNNDTRTHNIRIFEPGLDFDSGAQEPGETVEIAFPKTGSFLVFCGIHPKMELYVDVGR